MTPDVLSPRQFIALKRDGGTLPSDAIDAFIRDFVAGNVADYQMTAFLMAVYFQGLTGEETAALTRAMVDSGSRLRLDPVPGLKVDKHSTGGVGDKVSIPLAPLVSACGVPVPMISGRGLGHTGGTLDKLESIPGFRTALTADEFLRILREVGYAMGGQTAELAPADRRMYALRDVTATVESIPLIVSSILSKKVAEGAQALVMDVKCGRGAFMPDEEHAVSLGRELSRVGGLLGLRTAVFITDMDRPLGRTVGHSLEIEESIDLLQGRGAADLTEITLTLGSAMLVLGKQARDMAAARERLGGAIADGSGLAQFRRLVEAQGGDPSVIDDPSRMPRAAVHLPVPSPADGYVSDIDPRALGEAVIELGGGRRQAGDAIDHAVGIRIPRAVGEPVGRGEPILMVEARDEATARNVVEEILAPGVKVSPRPVTPPPLIRRVLPWEG